jgi:hypothetical protein
MYGLWILIKKLLVNLSMVLKEVDEADSVFLAGSLDQVVPFLSSLLGFLKFLQNSLFVVF